MLYYEEFGAIQAAGCFPGPEGRNNFEFEPLGKVLNLSEPQSLHPYNGDNDGVSSSSLEMVGFVEKIM